MPSRLSRNLRKLNAYATTNGQQSVTKRPLSCSVPTLKEKHAGGIKRPRSEEPNGRDSAESGSRDVIDAEVVAYLKDHCTNCPSRISKAQATVITALSSTLSSSGLAVSSSPVHVTRVNVNSKSTAPASSSTSVSQSADTVAEWNSICLAALQVHVKSLGKSSVLALVPNEGDAKAIALHAKTVFSMSNVTLFVSADSKHTATPAERDYSPSNLGSALLIVATLKGLMHADTSSPVWSSVAGYVLCGMASAASSQISEAAKVPAEAAAKQFSGPQLKRQCNAVFRNVRGVVVLERTLNALSEASFAWLMPTANENSLVAGGKQGSKSDSTKPPHTRTATKIHYAAMDGTARFQFLLSLLQGLQSGCGLVVHFATKETCRFAHDILFALDVIPKDVRVFCDFTGPSEYSAVKDESERGVLCTAFDTFMDSLATDALQGAEKRALFLSAFGLTPRRGTTFLQYDVMVDVSNFTQFVADRLTQQAAHPVTVATQSAQTKKAGAIQTPRPMSMYRHVIVLLHTNEVKGALRFLQAPGKRLSITVEPLKAMPSMTRNLLAVQKLQSMNKKLFTIQNNAYEAYRATMMLYSHLQPKSVYNVSEVSLEDAAGLFGYADAPLLDLRTKSTPFRPKEDLFKIAKQQQKHDRRALKALASETIVGEQPEDHMADGWENN